MLEWLDQNATDMVGVAGSEIERTYLSTTV
jgi:hypothetical protein